MRISIISDVHFGDPTCQLAHFNPPESKQNPTIGSKYESFCAAVGKNNNYLVLLGDIFDFSIASYEEAYTIAKVFFRQLQRDRIAERIIYVPGNHDFDMWHFYEYDVNVIRHISHGRPPRAFRFSVPAILDCRSGNTGPDLTLFGVDRNPESSWGYGGLFLDKITTNENQTGSDTSFALAYPNVYLLTDDYTVLLTHGHYLEAYWSLLSDWALRIAGADLRIGDTMDLAEMVAINFPLNQLACTGVGQAGPLTGVIQPLVQEVKEGNLERIKRYLNNLDNEIDKMTPARWLLDPAEAARDAACNYGKKWIIEQLEETKATRFSEEFLHTKETLDRFRSFYNATQLEIDYINQQTQMKIANPRYVIFGHTHDPILWGADSAPWTQSTGGQPLTLYNTGGWLSHKDRTTGKMVPCGAAVFTFDSKKTPMMTSQMVTEPTPAIPATVDRGSRVSFVTKRVTTSDVQKTRRRDNG